MAEAKAILDGNVINGDNPLAVKSVESSAGRHIIQGNVVDEDHPLAVVVVGNQGGIVSVPPPGMKGVTNIYYDPALDKVVVEAEE